MLQPPVIFACLKLVFFNFKCHIIRTQNIVALDKKDTFCWLCFLWGGGVNAACNQRLPMFRIKSHSRKKIFSNLLWIFIMQWIAVEFFASLFFILLFSSVSVNFLVLSIFVFYKCGQFFSIKLTKSGQMDN
jgi:hypothetical protein